jgi:hypothetical protein
MEKSSLELLGAITFFSFGSSSLELLKTNNYNINFCLKNLKLKEGRGAYLLAYYNTQWKYLNLKMNKNHILYTFETLKNIFLQEMKSK